VNNLCVGSSLGATASVSLFVLCRPVQALAIFFDWRSPTVGLLSSSGTHQHTEILIDSYESRDYWSTQDCMHLNWLLKIRNGGSCS
jgi:hypothetical protein